jgi:glutathione synthase/RimK-type ligase-like ATP-grasp enzyme
MPRKLVLLIAHDEHDTTTGIVRTHLARDSTVETLIFNGELLGRLSHGSMHVGNGQNPHVILQFNDRKIHLDDVHSVWNRRWHEPRICEELGDTEQVKFARANWRALFDGFWENCDAKWVNNPLKQARANNKLLQISIAKQLGFDVPDTLFTSDPNQAREFIETHHQRAVCKTLSYDGLSPSLKTTRLNDGHADKLASLAYAPAIFQEYVEPGRDIRAVVIGEDIFVGEIDPSKGRDKVDWRADNRNAWSAHSLPSAIKDRCIGLTESLGLSFGAIDLRLDIQGTYRFFEINPAGQFMFLELWTNLPIASCLAAFLAK